MIAHLRTYLNQEIRIAPLITFRILFGLLMAWGALRFMQKGWIEELYGEPLLFFRFYGFEWLPILPVWGMYLVYSLIVISALGIALGWRYRISTRIFFLSFSYAELTDLTNYLNHYYLVMLLAFWLIWIPAHRAFSIDAWRHPAWSSRRIPRWCRLVLIFQLVIVYFYAGLAKLNVDWLLHAMPMAVWLPTKTGIPGLSQLFQYSETAFLFSWAGAIYDLAIPFFLIWKRTRGLAYVAVVVFHLLTLLLFNIGLFPMIMITSTLVFFSAPWHQKLHRWSLHVFWKIRAYWGIAFGASDAKFDAERIVHSRISSHLFKDEDGALSLNKHSFSYANEAQQSTAQNWVGTARRESSQRAPNPQVIPITTRWLPQTRLLKPSTFPRMSFTQLERLLWKKGAPGEQLSEKISAQPRRQASYSRLNRWGLGFLVVYALFQLLFPLRHWAYPGNVRWTEEGYRFSWRVMLVEKNGQATFTVKDANSGQQTEIINRQHLTPFQEKQMAIQPDFMLQYAQYLADYCKKNYGFTRPSVFVEAHVALNGRSSYRFIDPNCDLLQQTDNWSHKDWILIPAFAKSGQ